MCFFNKKTLKDINKNLEDINSSLKKISKKIDNSQKPNRLHINNIDKNIKRKDFQSTYTKEYNIIHIISAFITITFASATILGAIILFIYLKNIDSTNLLPKSLFGSNLAIFSIILILLNSITFIIAALPLLLIKKYEHTLNYLAFPLPTCYVLILIGLSKLDETINQWLVFTLLFITYLFLAQYKVSRTKINHQRLLQKIKRIYKINKSKAAIFRFIKPFILYDIEKLFILSIYYILSLSYSTIFIVDYNQKSDDYIYIIYSAILPLMVISSGYFSSIMTKKDPKASTIKFLSIVFIMAEFLFPIIIFSTIQIINSFNKDSLESHNTDKIMIAFGYQDRKEKIYYIEENFIKTNINAKTLTVKVEKHKIEDKRSEYNEYSARCGKIYWSTSDTVVFKQEKVFNEKYANKFIQIPANQIFEYQGKDVNCDTIKIIEIKEKIADIMSLSKIKPNTTR